MHNSCRTCVLNIPQPELHSCSTSICARRCLTPAERSCAYTRMSVSTKHLPLMQFTPRAGWSPTQVKARPQPSHGASARLVVSLALAHGLLQPDREQGADGRAFFSSENTSFLQQICLNLQCNIGFHRCTYLRVAQVYVLRAGNSSRICRMCSKSKCNMIPFRDVVLGL